MADHESPFQPGYDGAGQGGSGQGSSGYDGAGQSGAGQGGSGHGASGYDGAGHGGSGHGGSGYDGSGHGGSGYDGAGHGGSGHGGSGHGGSGYDGPPPTVDPAAQPYSQFGTQAPQFGTQGPPSYPAAPPYGSGYQPQYLPGPYPIYPTPQSNGLAIAALICGIMGFFCVTPFAAIGLGIGGLQQSKRTGAGRTMSIWGICLGAAWLMAYVGFIVVAVVGLSN